MCRSAKEQRNKKKIFHGGRAYIALVVLVASILASTIIPHIDDVTYTEVLEKNVLNTSDMLDSESPYDHVEENVLITDADKGPKLFTSGIFLLKGDSLRVSFTAVNKADKKTKLTVDLYGDGFDDPCDEFTVKLKHGENKIRQEIAFYRGEHPESCQLRIFTSGSAGIEIKNLKVDFLTVTRDSSILVWITAKIMQVVLFLVLSYLIIYVWLRIKRREPGKRIKMTPDFRREVVLYAAIVFSVTILLLFLYRKADISFPLVYAGGDEMGVYYLAKNIDRNGLSMANPLVGGLSGGDMFDYPYSDSLSFICVKLIGLFSDNPYLIINLFYFANFYLIAIIAAAASRNQNVSRSSSYVVGILFAFSSFIQMRYVHIWLTPYYTLPIACMLSLNVVKGRIPDQLDPDKRDRQFWCGMMLAFMCAFTGMYYAYFTCALLAASMVIRIINKRGRAIKKEMYPLAFIASTVTGVVINAMPNVLYWVLEGTNSFGELAVRNRGDVETFGLKLVQLILPRIGHRIALFNSIAAGYFRNYPLVNENSTASIGLIASLGLLVSLLLIFSDKNKYKEISWLNFATFIIATIGGIGSIISVAIVLPMRSYNRMSLIIMFLSLLIIGMMIDGLRDIIDYRRVICISLCILAVGIFDQTVDFIPYDTSEFNNSRQFFGRIESELNSGDMIFTLPYLEWPSSYIEGSYGMFNGYLETENIHWSYGAMQGREEAQWQKAVAKCEVPQMISKIKNAGYGGIYLDKKLYERNYKKKKGKAEKDIESITREIGVEPLISEDGAKYFWKIGSGI